MALILIGAILLIIGLTNKGKPPPYARVAGSIALTVGRGLDPEPRSETTVNIRIRRPTRHAHYEGLSGPGRS